MLRNSNVNTLYNNVSQPVCRGTLVYRERFPGVSRKVSEKNYLGTLNFAVFVCEINEIRSEVGFFSKRINFGKEIHKKEHEFS